MNITVSDAVIHCEIAGKEDAPALLFLHGNGENLHIFDHQINYFSQFYRTIAIDTRAHGKSTRGTKPLNFHTFASDLIETLNSLHIDKVHVVGFSDGAITALHAALLSPERISSMVLLGANYNPKGIKLIYRLQIIFVYVCLTVISLFFSKYRKRKEIWSLMVNEPNLTIEEISKISIPTIVITGETDMASQRQNDEISKAIKGSQRVVIKGGNHFWMFKKPEMLNHYIQIF